MWRCMVAVHREVLDLTSASGSFLIAARFGALIGIGDYPFLPRHRRPWGRHPLVRHRTLPGYGHSPRRVNRRRRWREARDHPAGRLRAKGRVHWSADRHRYVPSLADSQPAGSPRRPDARGTALCRGEAHLGRHVESAVERSWQASPRPAAIRDNEPTVAPLGGEVDRRRAPSSRRHGRLSEKPSQPWHSPSSTRVGRIGPPRPTMRRVVETARRRLFGVGIACPSARLGATRCPRRRGVHAAAAAHASCTTSWPITPAARGCPKIQAFSGARSPHRVQFAPGLPTACIRQVRVGEAVARVQSW